MAKITTVFTDLMAALEEAEFLAAATGHDHALVDSASGFIEVVPADEAKAQGRRILEICVATSPRTPS